MERFLKHFDYYTYDYALKRTGLVQEEIDDWVMKGSKMKGHEDNIFHKFRTDFKNISIQKYIEYRKKEYTRHKSAKKVGGDKFEMENSIKENDSYKKEYYLVLADHACKYFKDGYSKEDVIRILDLTPEWLNSALSSDDEIFDELKEVYAQNALPNQMKEFLTLIKTQNLKSVLKKLNMTEEELNSYYEMGKNGHEEFKSFYEEYFEYKKETYIKTFMKTNSRNKALKKSGLTSDELNEHEDEFEKEMFERSLETVMDELKKGNTTKKACKKACIKVPELYEWLEKGLNGDETFQEFVEVYREEYLLPIKKHYQDGIIEGASEKEIIKVLKRHDILVNEDVKPLKHLNLFPKPEDVTLELDDEIDDDLKEILDDLDE